jgi:hypothetical protein
MASDQTVPGGQIFSLLYPPTPSFSGVPEYSGDSPYEKNYCRNCVLGGIELTTLYERTQYTVYKILSSPLENGSLALEKPPLGAGTCCPSLMLVFYIPPCRNCNFPEKSYILISFCYSVHLDLFLLEGNAIRESPGWQREKGH